MKIRWNAWICGLLLLAAAGRPSLGADPLARELMGRVRESMPDVPLEMAAVLRVVDRAGRPQQMLRAEALLTPREGGRTARYTILDAFGTPAQQMTVELGGSEAEFSFAQGNPLAPAPTPDLFAPIKGGEMSWMELSFSFFWWPDPRVVGTERVANRWDCQIVEIECPPELRGGAEDEGWTAVRLWVAPAYGAVVKGEALREGKAVKRFEVKSVKKLRKVYMIGDMEVRNLDTGRRARLKVESMRMLSPEYTDEEMDEFNAPVEW
jgi:hypothetical protein